MHSVPVHDVLEDILLHQDRFKAANTLSGVSGSPNTRTPMALATALAAAGAAGVSDGSPIPFAPNGPRPVPDSRMIAFVVGRSHAVGIRYSESDGA